MREVLSVAAGDTINIIEDNFIHACPNTSNFAYDDFMCITFRRRNGGEMSALYKVDEVIVMCPTSYNVDVYHKNTNYNKRIKSYIEERSVTDVNKEDGFKDGIDYRFYILSETNVIHLPHRPSIEAPNTVNPKYHKFSDFFTFDKYVKGENK